MWKWAGTAALAIVAATLLLAAVRARRRRRWDVQIDEAELNQWFRRRK
jgi:hypothetical protein